MNPRDVIGLPVAERVSVSAIERKLHGFRYEGPRAAVTSNQEVIHENSLPEVEPDVPIGLSAPTDVNANQPDGDIGLHQSGDKDIGLDQGSGRRPDGHGSDGGRDDRRYQDTSPPMPRSTDEFPPGASTWLPELSRRRFIELMGASLALTGLGACNRPPEKEIVPNVGATDRGLAGRTLFYATAMPLEGYGRGILVESHEGRPTKIEGNPTHPESLGATDAITQAAILSLYDPDRSQAPWHHGGTAAWASFETEWLERRREFAATEGAGLAFVTEPTTSPTLLRQVYRVLDTFPAARWYQHTASARYDVGGAQDDYDFAPADVVLAIDADFLFQHPASLRYCRAFASRRRVVDGKVNANRLYAVEPTPSVTGTMADHRLPASPHRIPVVLNAIAAAFGASAAGDALSTDERSFVQHVAADLKSRAPNVLVVAGPHVAPEVHRWAAALNAQLGARGKTLRRRPALRSDADPRCAGDLVALTKALRAGEVGALFALGANPVYTAPADLGFVAAFEQAKWRVHLGSHRDETAVRCDWHLPKSHFLESWGDIRGYGGAATILQPLIAPLYATRSAIELLSFLAQPPGREGYELVRETWDSGRRPDGHGSEWRSGTTAATSESLDDFETRWAGWLNNGLVDEGEKSAASSTDDLPGELPLLRVEAPRDVVVLRPDPTIGDGRWANNAWLQELPKPITQLVWSNAALVSAAFATAHRLEENDVVRIRTSVGETAATVWIMPGQANGVVTLHLGYGRTHAGVVGNGIGADAYRLRDATQPWQTEIAAIEKIGRGDLVSTQHHFRMEGRDLARVCPASQLPRTTETATKESLNPEWRYADYRWAMAIDLSTCIGCSACVVACQAENNIPVVGREQVARGREMHWVRIDRYLVGDLANPRIVHQPVPCMHCEHAPCELVCPVAATVHSSEGLNDMVYNRCIGTRYCSNNCPYKVRRFNFFDFRSPAESPLNLQKNPNVTVRERGVMEKCTYCVQRIDAARIVAEKENRRIRDGDVRTACQQVCPVEAIVFGDLSDAKSAVGQRKSEPTHYALLEELNTRPRTTYLAKVVNPAADLAAQS